MMKEMIRKVMEWCKLWNGETATAKQAGPSSDKREKEQAADNREVQDRLENYLWKHYGALREDVHGPQRLPPLLCRTRRTAAVMQPHLFAIRVHRRRTGNPADDGEKLAQYALVVKIQPEQCH